MVGTESGGEYSEERGRKTRWAKLIRYAVFAGCVVVLCGGAVTAVVFVLVPDFPSTILLSRGTDRSISNGRILSAHDHEGCYYESGVAYICRNGVGSVAWSPDGTMLASSGFDGRIIVSDVRTDVLRQTLEEETAAVHSPVWSPDGTRMATRMDTGSERNIVVWDMETGELLYNLSEGAEFIWSPDGTLLATTSSRGITIWDMVTGERQNTLPVGSSIVWSPDGTTLATTAHEGIGSTKINLWDLVTGEQVQTLEESSDFIISLAWSPDGNRLASISYENTVTIWDLATEEILLVHEFSGISTGLPIVRRAQYAPLSPDWKRVASIQGSDVAVWDLETGEQLQLLEGHTESVEDFAWSPDGTVLATGSSDGTVIIWSVGPSF